jgi:hypothetical protein
MAHADVPKELARQVRSSTIRVFDAAPAECLTWTPAATSNHILWHAGHAVWLMDLMGVELLAGRSELPEGWAAMFGQDSQPRAITKWPSHEEVRTRLVAQLSRLQQLFETASDATLLQRPTNSLGDGHVLGWILHGLHDEARHNGEMYLLWKLYKTQIGR